jgi:O-antigen/teichoic acid export membrane protein
LPVINSLVFIFRSPGLSFQEAAITMLGRSWDNYRPVRNFSILLGLAAAAGLALIAWTPLSNLWLRTVSGLTVELADFALTPIRILTLMPMLSVLLSFQRSLLVARRNTGPVTWASAIEVVGILTVLFFTIRRGDWIGATAAAAAFMTGRLMSNIYLMRQTRKS